MHVLHHLHALRPFQNELGLYEFIVEHLPAPICHFDLPGRKCGLFSFLRPILLGLPAPVGTIKHTKHHNELNIFVVDCLPEIIEGEDGSLAEDGVDLAINQRLDLVSIDVVVIPDFRQLDAAVLV